MGGHARSGTSCIPRPVKILPGVPRTSVSARGSPAPRPWFGAARVVMDAGAPVRIGGTLGLLLDANGLLQNPMELNGAGSLRKSFAIVATAPAWCCVMRPAAASVPGEAPPR